MTHREIDINLANKTNGMFTEVERFSMHTIVSIR
jgi:hypothetical protein